MPCQAIPVHTDTAMLKQWPNAAGMQWQSGTTPPCLQIRHDDVRYNFPGVPLADHYKLNVLDQTKTLRFNSQNYTVTSGDIIGFQSKPAAAAAGTTTTYGAQISPRYADGITGASLYGLQVEPILQGATAAALSGDVVGLDCRLSATGVGHTVAGITAGIQFMNLLKASTFTGGVFPINILTHGDTQAWTGALKVAADGVIAKYSAGHYATLGAIDAAIKVRVGTFDGWIPVYVSIAA